MFMPPKTLESSFVYERNSRMMLESFAFFFSLCQQRNHEQCTDIHRAWGAMWQFSGENPRNPLLCSSVKKTESQDSLRTGHCKHFCGTYQVGRNAEFQGHEHRGRVKGTRPPFLSLHVNTNERFIHKLRACKHVHTHADSGDAR